MQKSIAWIIIIFNFNFYIKSTTTISGILLNRGITSVVPNPRDSTQILCPIIRGINALQLSGKPSKVRCVHPTDKRKYHLSAVDMTREYTVNVPFVDSIVNQPAYRHMCQKYRITIRILKFGEKSTLLRIGFVGFQIPRWQAISIDTADAELLAIYLSIYILSLKNRCSRLLIESLDVRVIALLIFDLVVAKGIHRPERSGKALRLSRLQWKYFLRRSLADHR